MEDKKNMNQTNNPTSPANQPVMFIDARVALSKDGDYVLLFLNDGRIIRKSSNLIRHVLRIGYQKKNGEFVSFA